MEIIHIGDLSSPGTLAVFPEPNTILKTIWSNTKLQQKWLFYLVVRL